MRLSTHYGRNIVSKLSSSVRRNYEKDLTKQLNTPKNIKQFFQYAKHQMVDVDRAVSLIDSNGNLTSEEQTASIFADHFSSVYNIPLERGSYKAPLVNVVNYISKTVITEDMILQQLEFLDGSKSPGPDGIHPNLLKRFSKDFANILFYIFNKSLESGILPSDWKSANIVVPIHKKDSKLLAKNYRPISLTSIVVKILESIIKPIILNHLMCNNIIHSNQHGFLPMRSCITNLLEALDEWSLLLDKGSPVDILYIDFAKAFDKVQHSIYWTN